MMIEYATITRSSNGTLDCVGQMTARNYTIVEYIEPSMLDCPPTIGEIGIVMEIGNAEVVWIGHLRQFTTSLVPGEFRLHPGQSTGLVFQGIDPSSNKALIYRATVTASGTAENTVYNYQITEKVGIDETGNILIQRFDSSDVVQNQIKLHNDNQITISNPNCTITINAAGAMSITLTGNLDITAPLINLN